MPFESGAAPRENLKVISSPGGAEGRRILRLTGPLTIHTLFNLQDAVRKEATPELILELSGVPYVDSAGLGALMAVYVGVQKTNGKLALAGMNEQLKALAEMTRVIQFFQIYPTIQDAEAALSKAE